MPECPECQGHTMAPARISILRTAELFMKKKGFTRPSTYKTELMPPAVGSSLSFSPDLPESEIAALAWGSMCSWHSMKFVIAA